MVRLKRYILYIVPMLTLLSSCDVWVPLCVDDHPHLSTLNVVYDWQGLEDYRRPDSMMILSERIVQRWNCTYQVNTSDYNGQYIVNNPADERVSNEYAAAAGKTEQSASETTPPSEPSVGETPSTGEEPSVGEDPSEGEDTPDNTPADDNTADDDDNNDDGNNNNDSTDEPSDDDTDATPTPGGSTGGDIFADFEAKPMTRAAAAKDHATFDVKAGEYVFMTYTSDSRLFDTSALDRYVNQDIDVMTDADLSIYYRPYSLQTVTSSWTDLNPYTQYVYSDANPFMYYMSDPILCNRESEQWITLYPHSIMQRITVNLDVDKVTEGTYSFVVDSIFADIAGIPYRFVLLTEELDVSKTYKMMLAPNYYTEAKHTNYTDTYDNTTLQYSSTFYATSLLHPASSSEATGPGIFQVKVYVHLEEYPEAKVYPIYARINLYDSVVDDPLLEVSESGLGAKKRGDDRVINIVKRLVINMTDLKMAGDGGNIDWNETDGDTFLEI